MSRSISSIEECLHSHDIRTPLHALFGGLEILNSGAAGPVSGDAKNVLAEMTVAARRLETMLDRLANLEQVNAAQADVKWHGTLSDLTVNSPLTPSPDIGKLKISGNYEQLSFAIKLIGDEILTAKDRNQAHFSMPDQASLVIETGLGPAPDSGEHQVTGFLIRKIWQANQFDFAWLQQGRVMISGFNNMANQ